ncbi:MAG: extracellular solute-binding protein [Nonomuraea sp.]|nr:extracellular solute-binding protein [Nonomuraea sp.]
MRRALPAVAIIAALALAVAACGGGTGGQASSPPAPQNPSDISGQVTWWDTSDATNEAPAFKELVTAFQAQHPKIKVTYVNVPFGEAQNKFKTAAQAGAGAPDVIRSEVAWTPEFASLGYLQPLDGTRALDKPEDLLPVPAASVKYDDKIYAVPQVTDSLALLYNKDLLKQAGHLDAPKTMDELKQFALDVRSKTDADGFGVNVQGYFLLPFLYGEGGDLLDVPAKKVTVDAQPAVAAINRVQDLVKSGAAAKPTIQDSYANVQTAFKDGKVAMIFNGPWSVADDFTGKAFKKKDNLGVSLVPAGGSGQFGAPVGGHGYAVYAGSKSLDASYEFVRFMASAESQARIAGKLGLLPARTSAYSDPQVGQNPMVGIFKPVVEVAHERPWIPEGGQLFTPLDQAYAKVMSGQATPDAALKGVADEYRKLLQGWS